MPLMCAYLYLSYVVQTKGIHRGSEPSSEMALEDCRPVLRGLPCNLLIQLSMLGFPLVLCFTYNCLFIVNSPSQWA